MKQTQSDSPFLLAVQDVRVHYDLVSNQAPAKFYLAGPCIASSDLHLSRRGLGGLGTFGLHRAASRNVSGGFTSANGANHHAKCTSSHCASTTERFAKLSVDLSRKTSGLANR